MKVETSTRHCHDAQFLPQRLLLEYILEGYLNHPHFPHTHTHITHCNHYALNTNVPSFRLLVAQMTATLIREHAVRNEAVGDKKNEEEERGNAAQEHDSRRYFHRCVALKGIGDAGEHVVCHEPEISSEGRVFFIRRQHDGARAGNRCIVGGVVRIAAASDRSRRRRKGCDATSLCDPRMAWLRPPRTPQLLVVSAGNVHHNCFC